MCVVPSEEPARELPETDNVELKCLGELSGADEVGAPAVNSPSLLSV